MAKIIEDRMFATSENDFVIFMIGMRINSFRKINKWYPVIMAMPRMLRELFRNPEMGLMGAEYWFGRTTVMVQYWKSFELLDEYAKNKNAERLPAWRGFNLKARKSAAVGIWHETYKISRGCYENIYVNMPPFGLGKAGRLETVSKKFEGAGDRMALKEHAS